ncbi:hypothetical protein KIPB_008231 [Kipferlia bialata]|uniref:Uncharacterized protein n=1 Tax=Kipferlia bialata TaxID=797122 RepID=A0A9K3GKN8_9EUKA|nr:hypothetical protein KIPB_008231 [Kipferlia bialata]|eukprot:g8231.t1
MYYDTLVRSWGGIVSSYQTPALHTLRSLSAVEEPRHNAQVTEELKEAYEGIFKVEEDYRYKLVGPAADCVSALGSYMAGMLCLLCSSEFESYQDVDPLGTDSIRVKTGFRDTYYETCAKYDKKFRSFIKDAWDPYMAAKCIENGLTEAECTSYKANAQSVHDSLVDTDNSGYTARSQALLSRVVGFDSDVPERMLSLSIMSILDTEMASEAYTPDTVVLYQSNGFDVASAASASCLSPSVPAQHYLIDLNVSLILGSLGVALFIAALSVVGLYLIRRSQRSA